MPPGKRADREMVTPSETRACPRTPRGFSLHNKMQTSRIIRACKTLPPRASPTSPCPGQRASFIQASKCCPGAGGTGSSLSAWWAHRKRNTVRCLGQSLGPTESPHSTQGASQPGLRGPGSSGCSDSTPLTPRAVAGGQAPPAVAELPLSSAVLSSPSREQSVGVCLHSRLCPRRSPAKGPRWAGGCGGW